MVYNNGNGEDIAYDETTKKDFAFSRIQLDTRSVEISYGNKTVKQTILVEAKRIVNVVVKAAPKKLEYIETERFEPEGLLITVSYNNGKKEEIEYNKRTKESFSFDKEEVKKEDKEIKITYGGMEVYQRIVVKENSIVAMFIKEGARKAVYVEGERFNPEGLILRVKYRNGTAEEVKYDRETKEKFSFDKDILEVGDQKVVIGYEGKEVEQSIYVQEQKKDKSWKQDNNSQQEGIIETNDTTKLQGNRVLASIAWIIMAGIGIKKALAREKTE